MSILGELVLITIHLVRIHSKGIESFENTKSMAILLLSFFFVLDISILGEHLMGSLAH